MKITITNNIALNGGDAAILLGMVKALKKRFGDDTQFVITGTFPQVCTQLYPNFKWRTVIGREADTTPFNHIRIIGKIARILKRYYYFFVAYLRRYNIPLYKLLLNKYNTETLNDYATSDYIISSGGTYLIEPYGIDVQYIDYKISLILGKPLVQYTQSMGPFTREQTQNRLRWVFNRCNTILCRDQISAMNVINLNIKNSSIVHIVPDAAFALGDIDKMVSRKNDSITKHKNVAISVRDWIHTSDKNTIPKYRESIADIVVKLIDMKYNVHFISTCQGITSYTDDNNMVESILSLVPKNYHSNIIKYDRYLTIHEIMDILQEMDFIIATRLHMSILGLISGTPVFPIAYEFKTIELYHSLGYDKVETIENITPSILQQSIINFIDWMTPNKRQEIYDQVASYINNVLSAANLIK